MMKRIIILVICLLIEIYFTSCKTYKREEEIEKISKIEPEEKIETPEEKTVEKEIPEEIPKEIIIEEKPESTLLKEPEEKPEIMEEKKESLVLIPKEKKEILKKPEKKVESPKKIYIENWKGECLIYKIKWNSMDFGTGILACIEEKNRYRLIGLTLPKGVLAKFGIGYNRVDTFIDKNTGKPSYFYLYTKSRENEKYTNIYFNWTAMKFTCISKKYRNKNLIGTKREEIKFDSDVFDCLGFFYFIRNSDLTNLKNKEFLIALPEKWYIKINYKGKLVKTLPDKTLKEVFIIEPVLRSEKERFKEGRLDIWLTTDNLKIPIYFEGKVTIGRAILTLEKFEKIVLKENEDVNQILKEIIEKI